MASTSSSDYVVLELRNPLEVEAEPMENEIFLSTDDISDWKLPSILDAPSIKVRVDRNRLTEQCSYFRGLLSGSFSESCLNSVPVKWRLETVIYVLRFINGCRLNVTANNFIPLIEAALFFGVEALLLECKAWFCEKATTKGVSTQKIPLDAIVEIWSFGLEHEISFIPELCARYIAQNFMWAISSDSFVNVPYNMLCDCLDDPCLTVDSEKNLVEALLLWLGSNESLLECSSASTKVDYSDILMKVRISLLPLWFAAGKKRCCHFSKLADESINAILRLIRDPSMSLLCLLRDSGWNDKKIRLTDYTERIDLSGCPQITSTFLILSVLPCLCNMDPTSRKRIEHSLMEIKFLCLDKCLVPQNSFPTLLFQAVWEVDFSKCPQLHLETALKYFCKSFPSLRTLKATHCPNFEMKALFHLIENCPSVKEVDLTADISPAIPMQVSTISTHIDVYQDLEVASSNIFKGRSLTSYITKLTLAGRRDIEDSDILIISVFSASLTYLNLKGCTSLTDVGISELLCKCLNLHSLVVSDTCFGRNSILALCSNLHALENFSGVHHEHKDSTLLASKLQKLHIGGCKSVDAASLSQLFPNVCALKSFCLRGTKLVDDALFKFSGSSLERLDVSETMVSGAALTYIIKRNSGLKCFKSTGCRNLCHLEGTTLSYGSFKGQELYTEIGKICTLEDVAFGWGFSSFSLLDLGPAIRSLRAITVGLGASLNHYALMQLSKTCPLLESVVLKFQVLSDCIVKGIVESLRDLKVLGLCYCVGELSSVSFCIGKTNIRKLRLERVTPWMTNDDLVVLTENCTSLIELQLSGCTLLNSDSQQIISRGWPGLISIHLEDCGEVTSNGIFSLFDCKAIEDLSLRHNGCGIPRSFVVDAASKMPMLRKVALDLCDTSEGGFDSPSYTERFFLSIVKIARCKPLKCAFNFGKQGATKRSVHKESIILEWNSKGLRTTIVKERV